MNNKPDTIKIVKNSIVARKITTLEPIITLLLRPSSTT